MCVFARSPLSLPLPSSLTFLAAGEAEPLAGGEAPPAMVGAFAREAGRLMVVGSVGWSRREQGGRGGERARTNE